MPQLPGVKSTVSVHAPATRLLGGKGSWPTVSEPLSLRMEATYPRAEAGTGRGAEGAVGMCELVGRPTSSFSRGFLMACGL